MVDHWLKNNLYRLIPQYCLLCGTSVAGTHDLPMCEPCCSELPILGETCLCCANPLEKRLERLADLRNHSALMQTRLCGQCLHKPPHFDDSIAFFPYSAPFDHLIQAAKFAGKLAIAQLLGRLFIQQLLNTPDLITKRPDGLLPVPLHPERLKARGYNQAHEIARPVSKALQRPILDTLVQRTVATPPQSSLTRKQRQKNLQGAFHVVGKPSQQHVVIIDDVMTSGATANALALQLKHAGVQRVSVWCICRAVPL